MFVIVHPSQYICESLLTMPDWSYKPFFQPILFQLPAAQGRDLTLGAMGRLARLPFGRHVISFLGHMRPDSRLQVEHMGMIFPTRVGLGNGIDTKADAIPALAQFGLGFLEVGPVTVAPSQTPISVERHRRSGTIQYSPEIPSIDLETLIHRLSQSPKMDIPLMVRLGASEEAAWQQMTDDCCQIIERIGPYADFFSVAMMPYFVNEDDWQQHCRQIVQTSQAMPHQPPLVMAISPNMGLSELSAHIDIARSAGMAGVSVEGCISAEPSSKLMGRAVFDSALALVSDLRQHYGNTLVIISSGGIHEPIQARQFIDVGADLIQVDSGLVFAGPGLPKRINQIMLYDLVQSATLPIEDETTPPPQQSWFWTSAIGLAMFIGGLMAIIIATTRVVLPYDETFVDMTRDELMAINERLLPFLTHDRVTLAGAMLAIGTFYLILSIWGIRRGLHWAQVTVLYSALAGFFSFFLFLGFGYFDPFHAFVTAIMFQFMLLGLHSKLPNYVQIDLPDLRNNNAWRRSLLSQLIFIIKGSGMIVAGLIISWVGISSVFVAEDLEFMQTTVEALRAANPRIIPLVAHDRATLGGMLIASGISMLLAALWGYRRGARWLWWGLLISNVIAYVAAILVHITEGYVDLAHLSPAFLGLALVLAASWLSHPYLCKFDNSAH